MTSKKRPAQKLRWDGPPAFIPGWGRLEPGKTYPVEQLPKGADRHPRMTLAKEDDHE